MLSLCKSFTRLEFLIWIFIFSVATPGIGQAGDFDQPKKFMSEICENLISDKKRAVDRLIDSITFGTAATAAQIDDQKNQFTSLLERAQILMGKVQSCKFAFQEEVGKDVIALHFVILRQLKPNIITGHFFKIDGEWKLHSFDYTDLGKQFPYQKK